MSTKKTGSSRGQTGEHGKNVGLVSEHGADFKIDVDQSDIKAAHHIGHILEEAGFTRVGQELDTEVVTVTGPTKRAEPFPRLYVLIDRDRAPVSPAHLRERDAYEEKRAFADAGITVDVVPYEPVVGGRR